MATYDYQNDHDNGHIHDYTYQTHGYDDQTYGHDHQNYGHDHQNYGHDHQNYGHDHQNQGTHDDGYQEGADGEYNDQGYPDHGYHQHYPQHENDDYGLDNEEGYHGGYDLDDPEHGFDQTGDDLHPEYGDYLGDNEHDKEGAGNHTDDEHPDAAPAQAHSQAVQPAPPHSDAHMVNQHPAATAQPPPHPPEAAQIGQPHPGNEVSHTTHTQEAHIDQSVEHSKPGGPTLNIDLFDTFDTDDKIYAYVIGQAIDQGDKLFLLSSDGKSPYYPTAAGSLQQDVAIELHKGDHTVVTIPHIAGGRIYFSKNDKLGFSISAGISLVEPSVTNASDPNYFTEWGFVELTFNKDQVYANISYVDFVGTIPLGLSLDTASSGSQHVSGMTTEGLEQVCQGLMQQHTSDGHDWDKLIVDDHKGNPLRVLSLNQAVTSNPHLFPGYYDQYIDEVWSHLSSNPIHVDTQAAAGVVTGQVHGDKLAIGSAQLSKPATIDVLTCNTGPFTTGSDASTNAIIPRIGAAFNRSTFITTDTFPEDPDLFYKEHVTNHYSRVVHEANVDGKGYAFPYDDVQKTGGSDQSGEVHAGSNDATLLTVYVGGGMAGEHEG